MTTGFEPGHASTSAPNRLSRLSLERVGLIVLALWFLLPGFLGVAASVLRYQRGDFAGATTPLITLGVFLVQSLAGVLVLAGRQFVPMILLLLECAVILGSLSGLLPGSPSEMGGVAAGVGQGAFAALGVAAILGQRYRIRAQVRRAFFAALVATFALNLPGLATRLGRGLGEVAAPPPVSYVAEIGQRLHGLRLIDLSGSSLELTEPGTLYVLNFWATWCVPCREELPLLLEMFKTLPEGVPVRLMAVNTEGLDRESIEAFLEKEGLRGLDAYTDPAGAQDLLGTGTIPLTVVIRDRTLLTRHVGYGPDTVPSLKAEILRFLRDVGPEASPQPPS